MPGLFHIKCQIKIEEVNNWKNFISYSSLFKYSFLCKCSQDVYMSPNRSIFSYHNLSGGILSLYFCGTKRKQKFKQGIPEKNNDNKRHLYSAIYPHGSETGQKTIIGIPEKKQGQKTITVRSRQAPGMMQSIKNFVQKNNRAYKTFIRNGQPEDMLEAITNMISQGSKLIEDAKDKYSTKQVEHYLTLKLERNSIGP